jgi:uncharacterized protein
MKKYLIKLKKGDQFPEKFIYFCQTNKIYSCWFAALGAVSSATLAFYNLKDKKYQKKNFQKPFEIVNCYGNLGTMNDKIIVHCHTVLADDNFSTIGGHLEKMIIAATCEIIVQQLEQPFTRKFDEEIGLNLLNLN